MPYFDVNKTILMTDEASNKDLHEVIVGMLAENIKDLHLPFDGQTAMSYYVYVTRTLYLEEQLVYKKLRDVRRERIYFFMDFLKENYPEAHRVSEEHYQIIWEKLNRAQQENNGILQSFVYFIEVFSQFIQRNESYQGRIAIRTFGDDLPRVEKFIKDKFDREVEYIEFQKDGSFVYKNSRFDRLQFAEVIRGQVGSYFVLVQDNYHHWKENDFSFKFGKFFPLFDENSFTPFFDDNIKLVNWGGKNKNIISPFCLQKNQYVDPFQLGNRIAHKVNPYDATLVDQYYVDHFNKLALKNGKPYIYLK